MGRADDRPPGWLKLRSTGRGGRYSVRRGLAESVLRLAYHRSWPARAWGLWPGSRRVCVVRCEVPILSAGSPPLRVGFVSDLHLGPTTHPRTLDAAFDALQGAPLDVLMLGGDYVFLDATEAKASELARRVSQIQAATKLAVLGNHDLWDAHPLLERALARVGVEVLINASVRLPPPHDDVAVIGLDDPWTGTPDLPGALRGAEDASCRIVLCHAPEGLPLIEGHDVDLMLCGHTHGGQLATPWGPIVVPGPISPGYPAGFYEVGGTRLFVSRGIGGVEIPVRTFAPPDVAMLTLVSRTVTPAGSRADPG